MFKVGQKIVCVMGALSETGLCLVEGNIYTCARWSSYYDGQILIKEFPGGIDSYWAASASRFRPLDETFADEVLEKIKEQIEQEELVLIKK